MATTTKTKSGEPATQRQLTTYLILMNTKIRENDEAWERVTTVEAPNDQAAVKKAVETLGFNEGTFVAIPLRSWRERQVKVETNPRISIQ